MKSIIRLFSLAAFFVCVAVSCNKELNEQPLLELDRSNMKMNVGQSQKLNAELKGADAELVWKSTDAEVASVNADGEVTALAVGTAKIIVSAAGLSKECEVVVINYTATRLELNKDFNQPDPQKSEYSHLILKDELLQINPRFYNSDGERVDELAYPKYVVTESNPSKEGAEVLSVNEEGLVTALNPGDATVKVSGAGREASVTLTVKSLELSVYEMSMVVNQYEGLTATVLPATLSASERAVEWNSSSAEHVKVSNNGLVTALKLTAEPVVISARCGRLIAECMVTVTDYEIDEIQLTGLEGLKTADGAYQMLLGDNPYDLDVRFVKDGEDVTDKVNEYDVAVTYDSSDKEIAVIENGIISVKKAGSTDIRVSCAGKTASFTLNVIQCVESVQIISPESNPYIVGLDAPPFKIDYVVYPEDASVKTATFSSTDPEVATVDANGEVTVLKGGNANIVITTDGLMKPHVGADGSMVSEPATVNLILVVSDPDTNTSLKITGAGVQEGVLDLRKGDTVQLGAEMDSDYQGKFIWNTSTPNIISVDEEGRLTALSIGTGKVVLIAGGAVAELAVNVSGVNPTEIKINQEGGVYELAAGSVLLSASMTAPEGGDFAGVNWYSNAPEVATVNSAGLVTFKGLGKVTITARAKSWDGVNELFDVAASIELTIRPPELKEVQIILPKSMIEVGETIQLGCRTIPEEAVIPNQTWIILDGSDYASLTSDGLLTGVSAKPNGSGTKKWETVKVQLTVVEEGADAKSHIAEAEIQIIPKQPTGIELDLPEHGWIRVGQEWDFNPRVLPEDIGFGVTCSIMMPSNKFTSETKISSDTPGTISAQFAVANHTNLVYDSYRRYESLGVLPYWVESVALPGTQEVEMGSRMFLTPTFTSDVDGVLPTYRDVKWTSSNTSVAIVNEKTGEITAIAPGETTITVTTTNGWAVPSGHEQKSATCVLTVKASEGSLNVGDYFYSDGTWSSELQSDKTVVGVIFAKVNAAASDPVLGKDYPGCTHGLALGLVEYESQDFGSVSCNDGHSYYEGLGYDPSTIVSADKINGYSNSKAHKDLNASKPDYVALFNAQSGVIAAQTKIMSTPSNASSWYVPSYREMGIIVENYAVINAALKTVGGNELAEPYQSEVSWDEKRTSDWYWTSTIWGKWSSPIYEHYKYAYDISKRDWTTSQQPFTKCKVRVAFAF